MPFVQQAVPTFHCNVTLGTQRNVIYCSMKTLPNQEVSFITKDNSCFCQGRSLSQKVWCVCRLWSKQENKRQMEAFQGSSRSSSPEHVWHSLSFPAPHSQLVSGPVIWPHIYTIFTFTLSFSHLKHSAIPGYAYTCAGPSRRPKISCPQSFHDLHC